MKLTAILIHIIIIITVLINLDRCENECCFNSSYSFYSRSPFRVALYLFDNFTQLQFKCNASIRVLNIDFFPTIPLILGHSLNMNNMSIEPPFGFFTILFSYLNGFEIDSNPFKNLNFIPYKPSKIMYLINEGKLDFYSKMLNWM